MKKFRRVIFWCHLPAGVIAGLVVLVMAVTGVLLSYEKQMIAWADARACRAVSSADGPRLGVDALLARIRESQPGDAPATITLNANPASPAAIGFSGGRMAFLDPYTGEVLGVGSQRARAFFRVVTDWHRWLGASGDNRAVAKAVTGASNLVFLFLVVSGFYLWWPRNWSWSGIRNVVWFRRGLPSKARDFNWHNVIGFWSAVPLFIVVLSAVVISYPWASNLVYRAFGETPPAPRTAPAPPQASPEARGERAPERESRGTSPEAMPVEGFDRLWALAEQQTEGWESVSLRMPTSGDAPVTFTIDRGNGGQPQKRAQLTLNRQTGEIIRWEPFSSYTPARKLRSLLRFAHTGEVAGIAGQAIAGLASAGASVLVWTGLALCWRRFRAWVRNRAVPITAEAPLRSPQFEAESAD
jgi:uncharacterized iron-regulated membrane protein